MTLKSIRDPIMIELGLDPNSNINSDAKALANAFINQTIAEMNIAGKWEILKTAGSITTVDTEDTISLPSNCDVNKIVNNELYIISQHKKLTKVPDHKMIENLLIGDSGLPSEWRPYGKDNDNNDQIQVYPTPNSTYAGQIINFEYTKDLTALANDTDTSPFHEAIIIAGSLAKHLRYDGEESEANSWDGRYSSMLKKVLAQNRGAKRFTPKLSEED